VTKRPGPPKELGKAGRKLWGEVVTGLAANIDLPARERTILATACSQADQNAALKEALDSEGITVRGAAGQWRLNAAATELRQGRLALARLLAEVCLDQVKAPEPEADDFFPDWLK
jgi:P27 family predicted phage terminase small subunit